MKCNQGMYVITNKQVGIYFKVVLLYHMEEVARGN